MNLSIGTSGTQQTGGPLKITKTLLNISGEGDKRTAQLKTDISTEKINGEEKSRSPEAIKNTLKEFAKEAFQKGAKILNVWDEFVSPLRAEDLLKTFREVPGHEGKQFMWDPDGEVNKLYDIRTGNFIGNVA